MDRVCYVVLPRGDVTFCDHGEVIVSSCPVCGAVVREGAVRVRRKRRVYCSDACKQLVYRRRRDRIGTLQRFVNRRKPFRVRE